MAAEDTAMQAERGHLQETLERIDEQLAALVALPRYYGDDLVEQSVDDIRQQQRQRLQRAQPSPYFGRLDFEPADERAPQRLYIGKVGIQDERDGDILVVDWRAPVSSLFYAFTGQDEEVAYRSPDGPISGTVHLKRNFVIENRVLQRMVDSYVRGQEQAGIADEFLLYRLAEHKDSRLRDIVSTIQAEQDQIIRAKREAAMVIQGVAGSGKTTVALHRLAYLLYEYQDRMRAEKMMVFAPNQMFLDYISNVLPELGVGDIPQTTFAQWATRCLHQEITLASTADRDGGQFSIQQEPSPENERIQWKGSMACCRALHETVHQRIAAFVPDSDVVLWDGCKVSAQTIVDWFTAEYGHLPPNPRRERVLARLKRLMQTEYKHIQEEDRGGGLRKAASARLRAYARQWPQLDACEVYQQVLHEQFGACGQAIRKRGKRWTVWPEDLAPLVELQDLLDGRASEMLFDHVVIDEAQDFSPLQLHVLMSRTPSQSCTILGDLSQSIFEAQGIAGWQELISLFPEEHVQYFELKMSYRSTMEIVQFANAVTEKYRQVAPATPVFRSGQPVAICAVQAEAVAAAVERQIAAAKADGANTIAVLTRSEAESEALWKSLADLGVNLHRVTGDSPSYGGGYTILPIYLAKGLEFDAVILANATAEQFPDTALSAKLLYVAATRALHRLAVVAGGPLSALIERAQAAAE